MSRGLSVAQQNASQSSHRIVIPLIELFFDSGTLRLAAGVSDLIVGAETYTRANISVQPLGESASSTEGFQFGMNGLDPAIIQLADTEPYQGRIGRLLKAYLQADSNQIIGTPVVHFIGRMRNIPTSESNSMAEVTVALEHYDAELSRPAPLRWADADQQRLFPGDKGCEHASTNSDKTINWPSKSAVKYGNPIYGFRPR